MSLGKGGPFSGRKSLFGKEGSNDISVVDLNLTPLMDVLSNILFFLMATFGAAIVSFLAASVPVQAEADEDPAAEPKEKVSVNIRMMPEGLRVNCSSEKIPPEDLESLKVTIPRTSDGLFDVDALREHIFALKTKYPDSDTAVLVPSDATVYEQITQTIEAVKYKRVEGKKVKLLPKIVVADIVKADAVETPETE